MNSKDWQKVKEAFNLAVELPQDKRDRFLDERFNGNDELRSEVEKMLAADDSISDEDTLEENAFELLVEKTPQTVPDKIGNYKIIKEIGKGGMGTVYEAIRETSDFEQKVALKVIKLGMDTEIILSRFHHERQILASLQHPNIAGFIDGGMTKDGLPFYAMEFIQGVDIDDFCGIKDLNINERLKIFLKVCDAVQYAHQNFIAHRDLKPNNILIKDDGTVKLLDFGIAKVLSDEEKASDNKGTVTEFGMMTPAYASPEQVRGEKVGVKSDIYSLGVILYELLTGQKPFNFEGLRPDQAVKLLLESDPLKPSSVQTKPNINEETKLDELENIDSNETKIAKEKTQTQLINPKALKGDLDNIILKALKKSPERRYGSVQEFSEDIRRHLKGLPVSARPDTFAYRTSKFIKRNKVGVIASLLVFSALVIGLFATIYQYRLAQAEKIRAEKRFEQVRKLANNVVFKYHDAIADLPGSTKAREMLVKDAVEYLDNLAEGLEDNSELQDELARAYLKIGNVQGSVYVANLGQTDEALKSYNKSIEIYRNLLKKSPNNSEYLKGYLDVLDQKVLLTVRLNDWKNAEDAGSKLLESAKKLNEIEPNDLENQIILTRSYQTFGDVRRFYGGYLEAIEWYRRSLKSAEDLLNQNPQDEAVTRNVIVPLQRIGTTSEYQAEILKDIKASKDEIENLYEDAEKFHARSLEYAKELKRRFPNKQVYDRYIGGLGINLGTALARNGKSAEGIPLVQSACKEFRKTSRNDLENNEAKRDIAECLQYLAFAYDASGKPLEAIETNQESIKILKEITAKDPTNFEFLSQAHLTFNNTGDILIREGKLQEALNIYKRGIEYIEKMSKLNNTAQIKMLRSDSERKIGEVFLELSNKEKSDENFRLAEEHLKKSLQAMMELKDKSELGKIDEHKIKLVEKKLNSIKTQQL